MATELAPGLIHHPGFLDATARARLASEIAAILAEAPPVTPRMPRTRKPFSVRMSNAGPLGWVSDVAGYRYQPDHPETGRPWPALPPTARAAWAALAAYPAPPEACLINLYAPGTRMGLHQDRDEADLAAPVVSLSLGAAALFRYGGLSRSGPTRSIRLQAGDALVMGGASRLVFHGIDRLYADGDLLAAADGPAFLPPGGRCNLTLRRVTVPGPA
ncbi:alpha-ketoglutarate-dependent dioxygenase AlkB [Methylobacterium radiotolerans]|uniref:2OG-Fe(II) oxygenase n=1 Tax=Methylobacterium radiotolerans (strain ATCC 27329 / DSM 1819 / JCM 2831 / NBRC 15690 / NCIMB 10815 / 0-1) TaxID=426355 RepID=B1M6A8_METRJ|nr:alpha-ketoglutarate-dependent dioxygenase AlkB [Methylobacterium radiotolerans]ACB22143.1 2OG-Fe(II) oxygenase [Methylobacterium radiotolerans JCM 2831]GEM95725.1 alkylated DNA repair dioxygenase [Methylobacterium radiotolerans]